MPNTFSVPPRLLAKLGLQSMERLCSRAGVAQSAGWSTDDFFRLWAAADEELCDPSAGLRFGSEGIDRGYGVPSLVALHAPDFRRALACLAKYKRLTCPELVEIALEGGEVIVRYRWLQATRAVPRLLVDTALASLQELARRGTGGRVFPIRVELSRRHADPALKLHFGCPIILGAAHEVMVFERTALDAPFVTADGGAFARLLEGLEAQLASGHGSAPLIGEVRVAIAQQLSEGRRPSLKAVARRLAVGQRTLQRRLGESETDFQHQLAEVRRTTATRFLVNTELDPVSISLLLGFVEPNSFARAFHAWEQTTPLRWRERHARPGNSS